MQILNFFTKTQYKRKRVRKDILLILNFKVMKKYIKKMLVVRKKATVLVECVEWILDKLVVRCRKHSGEVCV